MKKNYWPGYSNKTIPNGLINQKTEKHIQNMQNLQNINNSYFLQSPKNNIKITTIKSEGNVGKFKNIMMKIKGD